MTAVYTRSKNPGAWQWACSVFTRDGQEVFAGQGWDLGILLTRAERQPVALRYFAGVCQTWGQRQ